MFSISNIAFLSLTALFITWFLLMVERKENKSLKKYIERLEFEDRVRLENYKKEKNND